MNSNRFKSRRLFILGFIVLGVVVSLIIGLTFTHTSKADPVSGFKAGRIIEDSIFTSANSMSPTDIQNFLNSKVPSCDTNGTQSAADFGRPDLTHAQYAAMVGWPAPPYTCLRDYVENGIGSAQIIYNMAQKYQISPKVFIVLLQKEQGLVTDKWPLPSQYKTATGYGCPDTAPCASQYFGLTNQLDWSGLMFRSILNNDPSWYSPYILGNNYIQWNPNKACGGSNVYIENRSTQALYDYTPYQPNQAALNAGYGTGDSCGAYGNRNFYLYFSDWFGSPNYIPPTCDARLSGTTCVWRLYDSTNQYELFTTDNQERDSAVLNSKYSYEGVGFYGFTSQQPGSLPVYRIYLSGQGQHFYTTDQSEMQSVLAQSSQNIYEGVSLYAYPNSTSSSISYPVYRLNGSRGHLYTMNSTERDALLNSGYTDEGIAFNAPSAFLSAPAPPQGKTNVYRLINGTEHLYTSSLSEADSLLRGGWKYEGITLTSPTTPTSTPIYRLYGQGHIYTASAAERDYLVGNGWSYEGIGWYVDNNTPPVYRFYTNGTHFYTTELNEALAVTNKGAKSEGVAFGTSQDIHVPVYRMHNGTNHFYTANVNELLSLANTSWTYEGIAWNVDNSTPQVYRLSNGAYHFYTSNSSERDSLLKTGWTYEGTAWQANGTSVGPVVYRLRIGSYYFYTTNATEKDNLTQAGWTYEGTAW